MFGSAFQHKLQHVLLAVLLLAAGLIFAVPPIFPTISPAQADTQEQDAPNTGKWQHVNMWWKVAPSASCTQPCHYSEWSRIDDPLPCEDLAIGTYEEYMNQEKGSCGHTRAGWNYDGHFNENFVYDACPAGTTLDTKNGRKCRTVHTHPCGTGTDHDRTTDCEPEEEEVEEEEEETVEEEEEGFECPDGQTRVSRNVCLPPEREAERPGSATGLTVECSQHYSSWHLATVRITWQASGPGSIQLSYRRAGSYTDYFPATNGMTLTRDIAYEFRVRPVTYGTRNYTEFIGGRAVPRTERTETYGAAVTVTRRCDSVPPTLRVTCSQQLAVISPSGRGTDVQYKKSSESAWSNASRPQYGGIRLEVEPDVSYDYRVRRRHSRGYSVDTGVWSGFVYPRGPWSEQVTRTCDRLQPPPPPTGLSVECSYSVNSTIMKVTWRAHSDAERSTLQYKRSSSSWMTPLAFGRPVFFPGHGAGRHQMGVTEDVEYQFRVRSRNRLLVWGDWSDVVSETCEPLTHTGPPAAPTGLTAECLSPRRIQVTWTADADALRSELQYRVPTAGRRSALRNWQTTFRPGSGRYFYGTNGSYTRHVSESYEGREYQFRVSSRNRFGASPWVSVSKTCTPPDEPSGVTVECGSPDNIEARVSWQPPAEGLHTEVQSRQPSHASRYWRSWRTEPASSFNANGTLLQKSVLSDREYEFRVRHLEGRLRGPWSEPPVSVTCEPPDPPATPAAPTLECSDDGRQLLLGATPVQDADRHQAEWTQGHSGVITAESIHAIPRWDAVIDVDYQWRIRAGVSYLDGGMPETVWSEWSDGSPVRMCEPTAQLNEPEPECTFVIDGVMRTGDNFVECTLLCREIGGAFWVSLETVKSCSYVH